jgi:hypothetical protein
MRPMTRARIASSGVAEYTAIQPLLAAVLMLCVSLVQGAATTLRMIFNRRTRDWHTDDAREALPQATSGTSSQGPNTTHGVILGLVPRISVGPSRGLSNDPLETNNRDDRDKAENDTTPVAAARPNPPTPNGGGAPRKAPAASGLRWRTTLTPRAVSRRGHTVPHLTSARRALLARGSSPARGRNTSALA